MSKHEFFRYPINGFKQHHSWASMSQIDGGNFGLEYADGAFDYNGTKFYIIETPTHIYFANNGDGSMPDDVKNKIFGIRDDVGFSEKTTSCFGLGSTKIVSARIGAISEFYTMSPNQCDVYKVNYPDYFPINNLHDDSWRLLNGRGNDVFVTRDTLDFEEYKNSFPNEVLDKVPFVPTWAMCIKKYSFQEQKLKPNWKKLQHNMSMKFVNSDFDFTFVDLTPSKPLTFNGEQFYFPTHPKPGKVGYISNVKNLDPVLDTNGNQKFFEHSVYDTNGVLVRTDKFEVYHYQHLSEAFDMINAKKLNEFTGGNNFKVNGSKPSTCYQHFFDHTGKWIFSVDAYSTGLKGEKYNFSNMVFVLIEGKIPYNVIKHEGAGSEFRKACREFHREYINDNVNLQNPVKQSKQEDSKVNELYEVVVGTKGDAKVRRDVLNGLLYMTQGSNVLDITYEILKNPNSHTLRELEQQTEMDWWIGSNGGKNILVEAMDTNLDWPHIQQFKWRLDLFSDEVEVGVLLIEGNPKSAGNVKKIKKLKKVIENRSLEALKEVWVVSFSDLINNEVDNFYKLDITKSNQ